MKKFFNFLKRKNKIQEKNKEKNMSKLYDITVFEYDSNGNPIQTEERGIHADSREELINIYKSCGQKINIIREYSDSSLAENGGIQTIGGVPLNAKVTLDNNSEISSVIIPEPNTNLNATNLNFQNINTPSAKVTKRITEPPKYFTVGGVECKMDNGKIYQKQWVRIIGTEAGNYRLISDSNNREISMNGKHLEVLKWVLVEDEDSSVNSDNKLICG